MMGPVTYPDWREPVRRLNSATGPASAEQLRIAAVLGCPHENEPAGVLTAIIEDWLRPALHCEDPPPATDKGSASCLVDTVVSGDDGHLC